MGRHVLYFKRTHSVRYREPFLLRKDGRTSSRRSRISISLVATRRSPRWKVVVWTASFRLTQFTVQQGTRRSLYGRSLALHGLFSSRSHLGNPYGQPRRRACENGEVRRRR